jgi:hypothetical protein
MYNGKKKMCYLVGQISPKFDITYDWRKYVRDRMAEYDNQIGIIDPCANSFNRNLVKEKEYAVTLKTRSEGIDILPHKDYTFVLESDIAIANMNQYDPDKPLLGSFFELAWYFAHPEKTVIGFAEDTDSYLCKHPFVQEAVNVWCNRVEEATFLLHKYFVTA